MTGPINSPGRVTERARLCSEYVRSTPEGGVGGQRGAGEFPGPTPSPALTGALSASDRCYSNLVGFLEGSDSAGLTHAELEQRLRVDGFNLLRQLYQDHLDLRAEREERRAVVRGADGGGLPEGG